MTGPERPSWIGKIALLRQVYFREERAKLAYEAANALLLPLSLIYLGERLFAGDPAAVAAWALGALMLGLATGSLMLIGFATLEDRLSGRATLLRYANVSRFDYVASQLLVAAISYTGLAAAGVVFMIAFGLLHITVWSFLGMMIVSMAVIVIYGAAGALLGTYARTFEQAASLFTIASTGGAFLTPVFYSAATLPPWLGSALQLYPLALGSSLARSLAAGRPEQLWPSGILLTMALGLSLAALRWSRWGE